MSNPYKRLLDLLPKQPLLVGVSEGDNGDGTTTVTLVGGGQVVASGSGYASGVSVFVKGGRIVSQAPDLSAVDINV